MSETHLSFGRAVYLWRQLKGLTQEELANKAELSRPNLSMIEQGGRDVTLDTARRIAEALEIQPGILVDGVGPETPKSKPLSRKQLDRIGRFVLGEKILLKAIEKRIAGLIHSMIERKLIHSRTVQKALPKTARKEKRSWEELKVLLRDEEIHNLIQRIEKRSLFTP